MTGMFVNSRGLGDLAKYLHFAGCVWDHNLDFLVISEMCRREFSQSLLNRLSGGIEFDWYSRPPHGHSGGILLGIRTDTMEVLDVTDGDFHIKMHIRNKSDNFIWSLVAVYGPAQEAAKSSFLCEMINLTKDNPHPVIIGGDFNMLRFPFGKSKGRFDNVGLFCSMQSSTA